MQAEWTYGIQDLTPAGRPGERVYATARVGPGYMDAGPGARRASSRTTTTGPVPETGPYFVRWLGPGSNRRPTAFQAVARTN